jgi:hypothetical protein
MKLFPFSAPPGIRSEAGGPIQPRRAQLLRVSPQIVIGLLRALGAGETWTVEGLPADACVTASVWDPETDQFILRVESETFPEVPAGNVLMHFEVSVTRAPAIASEADIHG